MPEYLYFGEFDVNLENGEIRRRGARVRLRGRPCKILVYLLKRPGEIVTREELIAVLWPAETTVNVDANLKVILNRLRHALRDSAEYPHFLETIHGVGYRFVAQVSNVCPVAVAESEFTEKRPLAIASASPRVQEARPGEPLRVSAVIRGASWKRIMAASIVLVVASLSIFFAARYQSSRIADHDNIRRVMVVLPFENPSGDSSSEMLADGVTQETADVLQRQLSGKISIIAGISVLPYKHAHKALDTISKELGGVDYVLEGTVRHSDSTIVTNAELIRQRDHKRIWTGTFEHNSGDATSFQRDIANSILASISAEISQAEVPHA